MTHTSSGATPDATFPASRLATLRTNLRETLPDAEIVATPLPDLPIQLGLINADYQTGPLSPDVMHAVIARPAYWAFCWGSGLALARWLLAHPDTVADKCVADIGSGSGIAAIAAAQAGASNVWACDNDPQALAATAENAAANNVRVHCVASLDELPSHTDLALLADVLYDRSNFGLLRAACNLATRVIVADSRVTDVEDKAFQHFYELEALTLPNLGEFDEFRTVRFFQTMYSQPV